MSVCAVVPGKIREEAMQNEFVLNAMLLGRGMCWYLSQLEASQGSAKLLSSRTELGCDLRVGRGAWLSLQLSVQACSKTAVKTQTSWFNDSLATLHYAVTPLTALQIFAGLCSGVWPLHPGFGGCRSWIKLCLGCSFYSAPLREPKKKKKSFLLVSTKNYREPKLDEKQNNLMHSEKADIKATVRNSVLCL